MKKTIKLLATLLFVAFAAAPLVLPVFAAAGVNTDVAGAVVDATQTYLLPQAKTIVNFVVFPVIDLILGVGAAIKIVTMITAYNANRGALEWHVPAIWFASFAVSMTMPLWIWNVINVIKMQGA